MRSIKLLPAFTAAMALLALGPAGASAAKHASHTSPLGCHVSVYAEPHVVTSGESVQLFGALSCPGGALTANQVVTVYERAAGTPGFKIVGTVMTGAGGSFSIIPPAITTDSFFYVRTAGARSGNRAVKVAPVVTLGGPANFSQLHTGVRNRVTFTGTVTPADAGAIVVLQRENATSFEDWGLIQRGVVGAGGTFTITHTFAVPGAAELRVIVRPHGKFDVRGISNTLSYEISQAQNPRLTINASADPISFGQSVTLSGILAGGANQKVALTARTHGQLTSTKIGEATTNGSGEYTFVETPLVNTSYRVTNGKIASATLFEGVKYVLTAGVSVTTVQAGHALTFSGTVTPNHVGQVVYLERENAFGGGYHVVDVGTVTTSSTYSITHFLFGSGKEVFRVKVPGGPENQGVASPPFNIEVTPAPPGSLHPEPPSKLPGEGKV
jgi:hypothetical protein